ncbi:DVU_1551 family NTP transferase [Propionivibrio soli]|uniref:DVU_1551 family NTP transferase n=1 Tax=Propionivibrio soli TaxID=2976531 RepID=UPI0021E83B5B|nr:NTP transferase domain-containing protein [Propionivibrio soli]
MEQPINNNSSPVLAALILAAGYSSRMGRFKPLLPIAGTSVIAHVVAMLRAAGIDRIGVVTGHCAEQIEPVVVSIGATVVRNPDYQQGMYSSIQAGIGSLLPTVDACFLLPVDIPLVRPESVAALAEAFAQRRAPITYPRFSGQRGHPPLVSSALFAEILAGKGEGGLRELLRKHQADSADVDVLDEGVMLDMDTPEDYAQLVGLAERRHLPTPAECEAILSTRPIAEPLRRHGRAVAAIARTIATRLSERGVRIDRQLVIAASLLHDIAKGEPGHAELGASIIASLGYPAVAEIIRQHMAMTFDGTTPNEAAVVFLADKLVRTDRRVSLEERYKPSFERFRDQPESLQGARRRYETACEIYRVIERRARAPMSAILADCGIPAEA